MHRIVGPIVFVSLLGACSSCISQATPMPERKKPTTFKECLAEGGMILKSLPAQCITDAGERFIEDRKVGSNKVGCSDACGNGKCEEMVCMMIGCPCAESHETCPSDCHQVE